MNIFNSALLILAIKLITTLFFSHNSIATYLETREANLTLIKKNKIIRESNAVLEKRVRELREGHIMIEEIAREELNYIKKNEIFIQTNIQLNLTKVGH